MKVTEVESDMRELKLVGAGNSTLSLSSRGGLGRRANQGPPTYMRRSICLILVRTTTHDISYTSKEILAFGDSLSRFWV